MYSWTKIDEIEKYLSYWTHNYNDIHSYFGLYTFFVAFYSAFNVNNNRNLTLILYSHLNSISSLLLCF